MVPYVYLRRHPDGEVQKGPAHLEEKVYRPQESISKGCHPRRLVKLRAGWRGMRG